MLQATPAVLLALTCLCATDDAPKSPAASTLAGPAAVQAADDATATMWIEFAGKPGASRRVRAAETPLTERALQRRARLRTAPGLVDARDLPVGSMRVEALRATGARIRAESRWLNAVSVEATHEELARIAALPFVKAIRPVRASRRIAPVAVLENDMLPDGGMAAVDYGYMTDQLEQIGVLSMHVRGFQGQGMVIGVLDTGFHRAHQAFLSTEHPLDVIAEWDFVSNDPDTGMQAGDHPDQHKHGTWILGTLAAYLPGIAVGSAFEAQYILAKTEDYANEVPLEEDFYVAGLEFIEANGGDIATSSLGYIDWYAPEDLDGATAVTTVAVNMATANGLVCLTAAGNSGHDADPTTNHIIAPADALDVLSCGAANADGTIAWFSSDGPSADGRVKPELLARGVSVVSVHSTNATGLQGVSGTSLSTPLIAGATALLMQARPDLGVAGIREALMSTASRSASGAGADPLFVEGYGMISVLSAASQGRAAADLDLDGAVGASDISLLLATWGPCAEPDPADGRCPADLDGDGSVGAADLSLLLAAWGG